jgi:hypothetical protein
MNEQLAPEVVDTLACELGRRPEGAPTIGDVLGAVRSVRRDAASLMVVFDPAAADVVAAVVDAERRCCSTLGWHLATDRGVRLRIDARPLQLDALEAMFSTPPSTHRSHG